MTVGRFQKEPVVFIRIFMGTTGIIAVVSGLFLLGLALWRLQHPVIAGAPAVQPPRVLTQLFTFAFLVSFLLKGVCWIMVALSPRLWNSTS
jgi:cytochrome b subunit of formate dehydrogenase